MVGKKLQGSVIHRTCRWLSAIALATIVAMGGGNAVVADDATNTPPIIGTEQRLRWNGIDTGQQDNTPLDGTIFCAAFGGPDNIAPPAGRFANNFMFDGGLQQYRPTSVDVAVTTSAINDSDRNANWVYAFQIVNDAGSPDVDMVEGNAIINSINFSLPPCSSGIDNGFPNTGAGISGVYVTEFGTTNMPGADVINFLGVVVNIVGVGRQFSLFYGNPALEPTQSSQIFFYYSPFGPSNRNVSINGGLDGSAIAHATINQVVTAQFYPVFDCTIDPVDLVELDPVLGNEIQVDVTINNIFPSKANGGSLDIVSAVPTESGNVLRITNGGGTIAQHERANISFTSPSEALDCVDFRLVSGGAAVPSPLVGNLDIDKGGSQNFSFFVFIKPNYFDACTNPLNITSVLEALTPYDVDPPFEGHTKFGMDTVPSLDADPDVNGEFCDLEVIIGQPPMVLIEKSVQFLDFSNPGNPIALPEMPTQQVDSPPCGKVKFTITVTGDMDNQEDITNFTLNDKLPAGLTFANEVDPPGVSITENPPNSGCLQVMGIPDLGPNESFTFCFRACVDPGTPPGILTNTADVMAVGATSNIPTNNPMDDASVNVLSLGMTLTSEGVSDDVICPPQQADFTFQVCNTGTHALEVTIPAAIIGAQLSLVNQNPAAGSVVNLAPAACQNIVVTVQALPGGPDNDFENCVTLDPVVGHPDMVDPGNTDCDLSENETQCIDVINPVLNAICLEVNPAEVAAGGVVTMTKRITNAGNVTLNPVSVDCVIDPGLAVMMGDIPADIGPLAPGETTDIVFMATVDPLAPPSSRHCVSCTYVGHPSVLPGGDTSCDEMATTECCVTVEGDPRIPTLSEWGLIALLTAFGGLLVRRRLA